MLHHALDHILYPYIQEKMQETKTQFYDTGTDQRGTEPSSLASYDMSLSTIIGKTDR